MEASEHQTGPTEADRQEAERGRVDRSNQRQANEVVRIAAEDERVIAEAARAEALAVVEERMKFYVIRQWVLYGLFFLSLVGAVEYGAEQRENIQIEAKARVEQLCGVFEREHARDVRQVENTKRFLKTLEGDERNTALNKAIIANLPQYEAAARSSVPPAFCYDPKQRPSVAAGETRPPRTDRLPVHPGVAGMTHR